MFLSFSHLYFGFVWGSPNWAPLKLDAGAAELVATPKTFMVLCLPHITYSVVQTL